jgi:PAS domain S-box-containing protein
MCVYRLSDGVIVDTNESYLRIVGYTRQELIGRNAVQAGMVSVDERERIRNEQLKHGAIRDREVSVRTKAGENRLLLVSIEPTNLGGEECGLVLVIDITERKRAEEQIKASLKEKDVLLKEVHHRVKNNLQVISSLLSLQSHYLKDQTACAVFQESQDRVRSMALVHQQLYESRDLSGIDATEYIRSLAGNLFRSYGVDSDLIQLKIEADQIKLGIDTAIPCGLLINELISNALKHAFPEGRAGEVRVELRSQEDGQLLLRVGDNGIGLPALMDYRRTASLGLQLVNALTEQLGGTIQLRPPPGTAFEMRFAELRYIERI